MGKNKRRDGGGGGRGGGNRGGHGGNNGGRVDKNNRFNNKNNNGSGQKYCEVHGQNDTHTTKECKTKQNSQNKNKNEQKGGKKSKDNNRNNDGDKSGKRVCCMRCGYTNHTVQTCSTKILPEEEWCECGCEYHKTSSSCIWNCNEEERLTAIAAATSKICQWCKGDGDGAHSFEDCPMPGKFRRDLKKRIEDTYDSLLWCWHCSSEEHKTRGCVKQNAQLGKDRWNGKITDIILDWKAEEVWNSNDRYDFENEMMENGIGGPFGTKAPVAHDPRFAWCLFCEEFGHVGPQPVCDRTEYERRKPTGAIDRGLERPFAPRGLTWANGVKEAPAFSAGPSSSSRGTLKAQCITVGCRQVLTFDREVMPFGQSSMCPRCKTSNPHPSTYKRRSSSRSISQIAEFIGSLAGLVNLPKLPSPTKRFLKGMLNLPASPDQDETPEYYLRRPSSYVTRNIRSRLPSTQVWYEDTGERPKGTTKPFMVKGGEYFNEDGNHQTYFPATKIRVTVEDEKIAANDTLPINRAGRLGLIPVCGNCGVQANVYDSENDVVMCGTAPANTLCYGPGQGAWSGYKRNVTNWHKLCNCLTIMGQVPDQKWVAV
ncbi:hypothetical protein BDV96DRAFT_642427 [Lophiotrema nucula]|uniref:Uncharacterized protein n=1 Tax=Lophiotrema nucula TaxID=690887 RepID=A0A6A5ZIQ2_9PLEO|nr:hypothetical protein BDV96DRAFT_642427 [Lophiotrema nucula]